jgi:hypothetical protein
MLVHEKHDKNLKSAKTTIVRIISIIDKSDENMKYTPRNHVFLTYKNKRSKTTMILKKIKNETCALENMKNF